MSAERKMTAAGLRQTLFEMIEGVRNGTVDDKKARTVAALAMTALKSVEVELQFRAQIMRGAMDANVIGELPLTVLPEPTKPIQPASPRLVPGRAQSGSRA